MSSRNRRGRKKPGRKRKGRKGYIGVKKPVFRDNRFHYQTFWVKERPKEVLDIRVTSQLNREYHNTKDQETIEDLFQAGYITDNPEDFDTVWFDYLDSSKVNELVKNEIDQIMEPKWKAVSDQVEYYEAEEDERSLYDSHELRWSPSKLYGLRKDGHVIVLKDDNAYQMHEDYKERQRRKTKNG